MAPSPHDDGRKQADVREEETVPLLEQDNEPSNEGRNDDIEANEPLPQRQSRMFYIRQAWTWFYYNGLVIVLAALLVVGTMTVVVLGCESLLEAYVSNLNCVSERASAERENGCMHHTWMCFSCIRTTAYHVPKI